jgi:hypothetical protein
MTQKTNGQWECWDLKMPDFSDLISDDDSVHVANVIFHPGIQRRQNDGNAFRLDARTDKFIKKKYKPKRETKLHSSVHLFWKRKVGGVGLS